jgi:hypothetical protein
VDDIHRPLLDAALGATRENLRRMTSTPDLPPADVAARATIARRRSPLNWVKRFWGAPTDPDRTSDGPEVEGADAWAARSLSLQPNLRLAVTCRRFAVLGRAS